VREGRSRASGQLSCPQLLSSWSLSLVAGRPTLRTTVQDWVEERWSPERIAHRLRLEHPDDPMMWMSHETIYQSLFVQAAVPSSALGTSE
jgi:IS30 family transposase